jgi:hypothetical protein
MRKLIAMLMCSALFIHAGQALAGEHPVQTDRQVIVYELVLRDGSRLFGTVVSQDDSEVVLQTRAGTIVTAKRDEIASLEQVSTHMIDGRFIPSDPNATRLFFGPTGRSLAKGTTYLGVYEFLMPFVQVGVTDRLSIGGGTPLVFGLHGGGRPFWVTPKLQLVNTADTQLAVGAFHAFDSNGDGGGVGYMVGTHGGTDASVTVGAGLAYGSGGSRSGVVMAGGERQVRRNLKLMTENYVWKGGNGVASAGVRFFSDRLSADLAIAVPIGADGLFAFPVVNFVYVF